MSVPTYARWRFSVFATKVRSVRTTVFGRPSLYARKLRRRAVLVTAGWGALAVTPTLWAVDITGTQMWTPTEMVLVLGASLVPIVLGRRSHKRIGQTTVGIRSEVLVARYLRRSGQAAVLHGCLLGAGGDADHIVLGPQATVVETKTGFGHVRLGSNGELLSGKRRIPGDPVAQVRRQARALTALVGVPVSTVVCVAHMTNAPFSSGQTVVCSARHLNAVLKALPEVMEPRHALDLAARLSQNLEK